MTTKSDYTAEEWRLITGLPWAVGLAVILAEDKGGRKAAKKELAALAEAPTQVAATLPHNALVQSALPDVAASAAAERIQPYSREKGETEQMIYQDIYRMCQQLAAILAEKSPFDEREGYKQFVLGIGRVAADAVADAEFLGIGGGTLSANERKLLRALGEALQIVEED
ncbi:MAG: hypothetical protein R6X34_27340 [Chloroflexota bacterium]